MLKPAISGSSDELRDGAINALSLAADPDGERQIAAAFDMAAAALGSRKILALGPPGPIVNEEGTVLGSHDGVWRYTPGQRRGIGLATPAPLFALRSDPTTNTLVVGSRAALESHRVEVRGRLYVPVVRAEAKVRYRSRSVLADVVATDDGFSLTLDEPVHAVAPGQVAVLYDDDAVVGAGIIVGATG